MSRVFEALTKAAKDKKREPISDNAITPENEDDFSLDLDYDGNHHGGHGNGVAELAIPAPVTPLQKTWKERIEELLFGWDLGRYTTHPLVAMDKASPAAEQYKILREQIKRLRLEAGLRSFSVTSPLKRDGKTTVAANLAATLALDYDDKILLIDGDLRAPSAHRYFNISVSPGLADYLASSSVGGVRSLVLDTFLPGLKVLPAGKPTHFAPELLAREKMTAVMDELRAAYPNYLIIVDSPPVMATPDPLVIARHVDGVMIVVRAGKTPRDYLAKSLQSINSAKVLGVVLNGANMGISSKYYYYYSTDPSHA